VDREARFLREQLAELEKLAENHAKATDRDAPYQDARGGRLALPILLAVGFLTLIALSVASIWLHERAQQDAERAITAHALEAKLVSLLLNLRRSESSRRGYLLSGDPQFLVAYGPAIDAVPPALAEIEAAVANNPVQREAFAPLKRQVIENLDELHESIRRYDTGDPAGAIALFKTGAGHQYVENITAIVERMQEEGERQLALESAQLQRTTRIVLAAELFGTALIVAVALMSFLLSRRLIHDMRTAQQELRDNNAALESTVAERTQYLLDANNEIQSFASIVSHDLRSPLVNIMGFTSELETFRKNMFERLATLRAQVPSQNADNDDAALGGEFDEAVEFIKGSIAKMDRLINAILVISREGRRNLRAEPVDMTALVRAVADGYMHRTLEIGAEIIVEPLPDMTIDRLAIEQVFSNLLDNAVKFMRTDVPGRIHVKGREMPFGVVYEVRDNGRGIDPKDAERVFELFRRSGMRDRQGEGIGLAHVRALVRRLGGSIRLASEPGQGCTFTVTLPKRWIDPSTDWKLQ
jgi:signal transduction histidine kinase